MHKKRRHKLIDMQGGDTPRNKHTPKYKRGGGGAAKAGVVGGQRVCRQPCPDSTEAGRRSLRPRDKHLLLHHCRQPTPPLVQTPLPCASNHILATLETPTSTFTLPPTTGENHVATRAGGGCNTGGGGGLTSSQSPFAQPWDSSCTASPRPRLRHRQGRVTKQPQPHQSSWLAQRPSLPAVLAP